jgi:uncharacterized membrane protein YhaH (DUF805 family)
MGGFFFWLIVIVLIGAILGFVYGLGKKGKEGAADGAVQGAVTGFGVFITVLQILLPFIIILAIIRSCS